MERPPRRQLGPRAHRGCQSKVTSGHPCPHLSLGGDLKHKPIGVRKKRRGRPSGGERAAPREPREGSLGRGQVEGGQRVGGLCDKRGTGDRGPVTEAARGGKPVLRMRKEALYQRSQERRGKLFASGQIPRCDPVSTQGSLQASLSKVSWEKPHGPES